MKSLKLQIQSALESLGNCFQELNDARTQVAALEDAEDDPPVSSVAIDRVMAHCQKAQRELQSLARKAR